MTTPFKKLPNPIDDRTFVCRGCLAESGEMKDIHEWGLSEDFIKFTDVQIHKTESISDLLCQACEGALLKCKTFRLQCQQSDFVLKERMKLKPVKIEQNDDTITIIVDNEDTGNVHTQEAPEDTQETLENTATSILYGNKLLINVLAPDLLAKVYFTCPYQSQRQCNEKFTKRRFLIIHMSRVHLMNEKDFSVQIQYYCSVVTCPFYIHSSAKKHFSERKFLNQHYNKVHRSKHLHCNSCSFRCSQQSELDRHLKTCNVTYLCEICNIEYKTNERLLVHLKRKHPDLHKRYKEERKSMKRLSETHYQSKKIKFEPDKLLDYICDSPKRSFATQTLENLKNDVAWNPVPGKSDFETKTDEISTQTVFEDLLSLKSQTSEDDSIFFSESVSLSDIQTQTFPIGLHRSDKETVTSGTQSPDLSIKETQTCFCLYDSPKLNFKLFDSVSSSPCSVNLMSTETQTTDMRTNIKSDVMLGFSSAETQTSFDIVSNTDDM